jgi:hypothetical protein
MPLINHLIPTEIKKIFNLEYSEYIKLSLITNIGIFQRKILAMRSFFGIAIPFGNSDNIPFSRSYFSGGSMTIVQQPYSLGPGSRQHIMDFKKI